MTPPGPPPPSRTLRRSTLREGSGRWGWPEGRQTVEAEREQYRDLFESAPAAYLVTDRVGVVQQGNRQAAGLFGVAQQFLVGRPLAMFLAAEDRWVLRDRLSDLGGLGSGTWQLPCSRAGVRRWRSWWPPA